MTMKLSLKIEVLAALLLAASVPAFAAPVTFREAAAPWNVEQALRLAPALTPEVIKAFEAANGPQAAGLVAKQKDVSGLLRRYAVCGLEQKDKATAARYLSKDFQAAVDRYLNGGCAVARPVDTAAAPAPRAVSLDAVSAAAASGSLSTAQGSARFFDGAASGRSAAPVVAAAPASARAAAPAAALSPAQAAGKPLSSKVPELRAAAPDKGRSPIPEGLGRDGRVNTAIDYWSELRRTNWDAIKKGDLQGAEKAKALLKAAAGAGFGGLLWYSNLGNVEIAAARLGWAVGSDAGGKVIAAEAAKLAFHSGVFILALAPIPFLKVAKAALAGEVWAVALVGAIAACPIDRYITHFAEVKSN